MPLSEGPPHGWRYSIRAWRLGRTSVTESTWISQIRTEIAIRTEFPDARIIMLTTYAGDVQVLRETLGKDD